MSKKMEIAKIVVQMGKREVPLSITEAKNLHRLLDEMFGEKVVERWYPYSRPYWYSSTPQLLCGSAGNISYQSKTNTACLSIT